MGKRWILGIVGVLALFLAGCGGDDNVPVPFVFEQLSDQSVDADISYDGVGEPVIFPATRTLSVRIGVDGSGVEYRGFLDFPVAGLIPTNANVQFAYVEVFVNSVPFRADVPVLMELVDFPPPLIPSDFFRSPPIPYLPPILGIPIFTFRPSDAVSPRPAVRIPVTSLVQEALRRGQPEFQVRILLDPVLPGPGIVELDDGDAQTAPLLHIEYF